MHYIWAFGPPPALATYHFLIIKCLWNGFADFSPPLCVFADAVRAKDGEAVAHVNAVDRPQQVVGQRALGETRARVQEEGREHRGHAHRPTQAPTGTPTQDSTAHTRAELHAEENAETNGRTNGSNKKKTRMHRNERKIQI